MTAKDGPSPESILADHTPTIRRLANRIRAIVKDTVPEAEERAYPGWHSIGFRHPQAGYFCGLFPSEHGVNIVFEHGRALSDPEQVLQGETKQTRSIPIESEAALEHDTKAFQALLLEGIDFGRVLRTERRRPG